MKTNSKAPNPSNTNFSNPTMTSQNVKRHPSITSILAKLHPDLLPSQHQDTGRLIYSLAERLANTLPENAALLLALNHLHQTQKAVIASFSSKDSLEQWTVLLCKSGIAQ